MCVGGVLYTDTNWTNYFIGALLEKFDTYRLGEAKRPPPTCLDASVSHHSCTEALLSHKDSE